GSGGWGGGWIQWRAWSGVSPSAMNVHRGMSGSAHACATASASSGTNGRSAISPSVSGTRSSGMRPPPAGALAAERRDRRTRRGVEGTSNHHFYERADAVETVTDGLPHHVARVNAFENDRKLVRGERLVEVELAEVAARLLGVALNDFVARQEAFLRVDRGGDASLRFLSHPVQDVQAEISERVAERRHLPVEHRDDAAGVVGRQHRVVEAIVAVNDRRRWRFRDRVAQTPRELVDLGNLALL